ncbi:MAG: hypothetical protein JRL30_00805 [Deltaproteobacteria bacterium]|nr:hypothetical protein [Deltaproteobacteria bacterium]
MSRCYVIEFKDGKPDTYAEFPNSWGGAARIWTSLYDKYMKDPAKEYDSWLMDYETKLWALATSEKLEPCERITMLATFDYAIIRRENFGKVAADLRGFVALNPAPSGSVDHVPAWADLIEASSAEAIGFHGTSVSEDLWQEWDEDADEAVVYDLNKGDRHFEIYERECEQEAR